MKKIFLFISILLTTCTKEVTFDIYQRSSDKPIYRISKNLNPKRKDEKFYILDRNGFIVKKSENLDSLIKKVECPIQIK